ncbi:MAG: glycosyltransferase family 2 protein [Bacteroidales bacterium]
MTGVLIHIVNILEILFVIYLGFAGAYIFIFSLAGKITTPAGFPESEQKRKFAVLIPGYKEDSVIVDVAREALRQDYPKDKFDVIVIADSFQPETLEELQKLPLRVVEVCFKNSTKSKALNRAMECIGDEYDIALILDADNVMNPDVIDKFNNAFARGYKAIQAHRVAKNTNTSFAVLDALSEEINNHIFRKGHRALGLSSALIGSGMAFDYRFFKQVMSRVRAVGGFDKELELRLLKDNIRIEYLDNAYVKDEKVQQKTVFQNQRKRWLSSQFVYFGRFFSEGLFQLFIRGNIDFACKWYQMIQPPRVLLLGITAVITLIKGGLALSGQMVEPAPALPFSLWLAVFMLVLLALLLAVPHRFYNKKTLRALGKLPAGFLSYLKVLFTLKGSNKSFIHTKHGKK